MSLDRLGAALAGRYTLDRELGAGGMATVYLAHDLRHDRKVAVKVLRPELAAVIGAERFLAEIKTTANLQHPHILPLFDSGEADSFLFYVMPYVEGISLRDRMSREKQLPIAEAVRIATEIASALDYAHRHGVIHRDIKPENIMLHDGSALVADFGIALAASKAGTRMTETGMSLGTPQYMSPEQAMGERDLDARSDVYALGCVTYEMLTGEPPFNGPTAQAIVAKIMTAEPAEATALRKTIPPYVGDAVRMALQKLPADRFHTAADFAHALANPAFTTGVPRVGAARPTAAPQRAIAWMPWVLVAVLGLTSAWLLRRGGPAAPATDSIRFVADLSPAELSNAPSVLVTPDGRTIIVSAVQHGQSVLIARRLDSLGSRIIAGSEHASRPFVSADGRWLAFVANNKLVKLPIDGGTPVTLTDCHWGGGTWGMDGTIIYSPSYQSGLWEMTSSGGEPRKLTAPDSTSGELAHWWPQLLPDGRHVIFTAFRTPISRATVELLDLKTGKRTVLVTGGVMGRYVASGHLLYARDESILAVPFDLGRLAVTGAAVVAVDDVAMDVSDGLATFDVSPSGTLAVVPTLATQTRYQVVDVDRKGSSERVITSESGVYQYPRFSPDMQRVSLDITPPRGTSDVWVIDVARGTRTRVTSEPASDFGAVWTRDGRDLIYMSERPFFELYRRSADGSRPPVRLIGGDHDRITGSVSADGRLFAYALSGTKGEELWTISLDGPASPKQYLANAFAIGHPSFSPDGHWMAYASDESGRMEVYLQSFPDPTVARHQVSTDGGSEPVWTHGGKELIFRHTDSIMAVSVDLATGVAAKPTFLFSGPYDSHQDATSPFSYDVSQDGNHFLLLKRAADNIPAQVIVTTNWWPLLRARMATGARP